MFAVSGADWAFSPTPVAVVPAPALVAPVLSLVPALPAEPVVPAVSPELAECEALAADLLAEEPVVEVAPVAAPAESVFRVVVVDLDDDSVASVLCSARSALVARRECTDEVGLPVAVFARVGSGEVLVWGSAEAAA
jgi:hypothetical protein